MSLIWTCPDCDADLEDEGVFGLWCERCQHFHPHALFTDPDNERDLMLDAKADADVA